MPSGTCFSGFCFTRSLVFSIRVLGAGFCVKCFGVILDNTSLIQSISGFWTKSLSFFPSFINFFNVCLFLGLTEVFKVLTIASVSSWLFDRSFFLLLGLKVVNSFCLSVFCY